jgi:AraC-like DNA-binding protein
MRYAEHPPPDALAKVLQCLWSFEDDSPGTAPQRIVPDGRCELVVHFGDPYREVGAAAPQPPVIFAGQLTRPLWLEATGRSGVIGARFHPHAARAFLDLPMKQATDMRLDCAALWPASTDDLVQAVIRAPSLAERAHAVASFVEVRSAARPEDTVVSRCVAALQESAGTLDLGAAARIAGLGRRQLERRFVDVVGISPALLANVFRFRHVFDAIERDSTRPWTDAAAAAGYFDQSHLVRDFRRFVGCTPTEFAASLPGLATALVS